MDEREYLLQNYRSMETEDLVNLRAGDLTDTAKDAISTVLGERGLSEGQAQKIAENVRNAEAKEDAERAEAERIKDEKRNRRDAFIFKIMLFIGVPLIIVGAMFNPERTLHTVVRTVVECMIWGLISWVVLVFRRRRAR